ncbi:PREDICTED: uncharacterized protein LOC106751290 [Dinoponera quadriceps]|uniref:Uncharacterized protein LOC106751290 n=1 Tax=Dinoponera quadriceps TaxID=609295 RepID=A0A6P3YCM3_DINQU|nr:PREDICTED: uncharacterized protein LOC106751290 [Dinoponera quadriceps]
MLVRAPCILPFVFTVCCWLRDNAAIPLASDLSVANQMRNVFEEEKIDSQDNWRNAASRTKRSVKSQSSSPEDSLNDKVSISPEDNGSPKGKVKINNQNVNVNTNILRQQRGRTKPVITATTHNPKLLSPKLVELPEDRSCVSVRKKNQRYSSSFIGNTTSKGGLVVDKEFDDVIGNNSKAKTTSSVHVGEDITLCWIETTTIKEDKNVRPPKRLVIREYTISFENSATIPDRYLECERLEGELAANDPEVGKTALFEVIDENTKASRIVNFTTVSNVGDVLIWQHKKVKCGVGPVVNKNIIEWHDGSKNPKKRVEIKVSPEIHQLAEKKSEEEPCTEEIDESSEKYNRTSESTESCENTAESGACKVTTHDEISSTSTSSSESNSKSSIERGSDETLILPIEHKVPTMSYKVTVPRPTSTTKAPVFEKSGESVPTDEDCDEESSDPKCATPISDVFSSEESTVESSTVEDKSSERSSIESSSGSSESSVASTIPYSSTEQTTTIAKTTKKNVPIESEDVSNSTDVSRSFDQTKESSVSTPAETTESSSYEDVDKGSSMSSMELNISTVTSDEAGLEKIVTSTLPTLGLTNIMKVLKHGVPDEWSESSELSETSEPSDSSKLPESSESSLTSESSSMSEEEEESSEEFEDTVTIKTIDRETTVEPEIIKKPDQFIPTVLTTSSSRPPIVLPPASSSEADYTCENSEDCARPTSTSACDETGDCHTTSSRSCESGDCLDEEIDYSDYETISLENATEAVSTTMVALTSEKIENDSTEISSIPTTVETRRSTLSSITVTKPRHKFTLKVKILLEHVNEKKEKENLVEVEKRMLLNENPDRHRQMTELLEQLKSLNDSVNVETMNALLNCTSLSRLTKNANLIKVEPNDVDDESLEGRSEDLRELSSEHANANEDSQYPETDEKFEAVTRRRRRRSLDANLMMADSNNMLAEASGLHIAEKSRLDLNDLSTSDLNNFSALRYKQQYDSLPTEENQLFTTTRPEVGTIDVAHVGDERNTTRGKNESEVITEIKNVINVTKMEVIWKTLPGIKKDVSTGLKHMMSGLMRGNLMEGGKKLAVSSLMGILANPKDNRIHSRRRREAMEEVGRWSNERIRKAPILGGNLRSFTEFTLYKVSS